MIQGRPTAEESPSWFKRKKQRIQGEFLAGGIANSLEKSLAPPLQYSCLENPKDGGAWWAAVHVVELDTTEQLHFHFSLSCTGEGNGNPLQCSCLENPRD